VLNDTLQVPEEQDFELLVELEGDAIPQQVDLDINGQRIPLVKQDSRALRAPLPQCAARPSSSNSLPKASLSQTYTLATVSNPLLTGLRLVTLEYPGYLGLPKDHTQRNTGDLTIPAGTRITWT
jgi:hypothetical protein